MNDKKLEYHRKYNRERYKRVRKQHLLSLGNKCVLCGSEESLEIDHINPEEKSIDIGVKWSNNPESIKRELTKCQILCRPCHIEKTLADRGQISAKGTHGTLSAYRYCKCDLCREANNRWNRVYKKEWRKRKRNPT